MIGIDIIFSLLFYKFIIILLSLFRALESTRDRVKRFIRNIGDKDVESIVHWVSKHNTVDGFLYFVGSKKKIRGDRFEHFFFLNILFTNF